jgi:GT2 family glycosyltransferase
MIEASRFAELNGFDERYFLFYEDIDLCLRANVRGLRTVVSPEWTVLHSRQHSTSSRFAEALEWSYESGCLFHSEHGTPLVAYRCYVTIDSLLRVLAHLLSRHTDRAAAYLALARAAAADLIARRPVRSRSTPS